MAVFRSGLDYYNGQMNQAVRFQQVSSHSDDYSREAIMSKIKITLFATVISLVASSVSLAVMGVMELVPFTATVIVYSAALTAVNVAIIVLVLTAAGHTARFLKTPNADPVSTRPDFSIIDPLTRTPNRHGITIGIMDAMALGERYGNPLSVAKLDLDHLDQINKTYGNEAGDRILAGVAAVTTDALRMPDKIGRYDDDEFILVMPQTNIDDAYRISDRLHKLIAEQKFEVDGGVTSITVSVGVTEYQQGDDLERLLSRVQQGVDESRSAGRNRVTQI